MKRRKTMVIAAALSLTCIAMIGTLTSHAALFPPTGPKNSHLRNLTDSKVRIRAGEKSFIVTLYDNPTANDLLTHLPMTVKANNYAGYDEKVIRLPIALSMRNAPPGDNPEIPEVGYYQPGQWIALYYGPIGYWAGKVPLGKISASVEELRAIPDNTSITIEMAGK